MYAGRTTWRSITSCLAAAALVPFAHDHGNARYREQGEGRSAPRVRRSEQSSLLE